MFAILIKIHADQEMTDVDSFAVLEPIAVYLVEPALENRLKPGRALRVVVGEIARFTRILREIVEFRWSGG